MAEGLVVSDLVAGYGGGVVLEGLSLDVPAGKSVALLGRNGVGKTTLLKTIMGLIHPKSGSITFAGHRIDRREPFQVARAGIGYVPQGREVFADLTVEENLLLGDLTASDADAVYAIFPALAEKRNSAGGRLSGGQQQQLAIGRALMAKPKLLLLDEPSEGIQPSVVDEIATILARTVKTEGMALLLVEQNVEIALRLTEQVCFIDQGRVVASETAAALRASPALIETHMAL
ncbi:MAG: ABC transporter ATP-binding protein [Rhizobiales bacterium]|nr:ABC transporter ATP-binding protein [Hyphomicrobiales bacterium]